MFLPEMRHRSVLFVEEVFLLGWLMAVTLTAVNKLSHRIFFIQQFTFFKKDWE
jgi:hypothetical protein